MIISYLNFVSMSVPPLKADAPMVVDTNAVLTSTVAHEALQVISWTLHANPTLPQLGILTCSIIMQLASRGVLATVVFSGRILIDIVEGYDQW